MNRNVSPSDIATKAAKRRPFRPCRIWFAGAALAAASSVPFGQRAAGATSVYTVYGSSPDLTSTAAYVGGMLPGSNSDVVLPSAPSIPLTVLTVGPTSTSLPIGTLNVLTSGSLTINNAAGAADTLTLNGDGGTNPVAPSAGDLLYVAGSTNLTISNGASGTLGLSLGTTGNFDIAGLATIGSVISGANGFNVTGGGTLTLTGANTFSGPVTLGNGTLAISSISNYNAAGTLGNDASNVGSNLVFSGGELQYTGGNAGTNRNFSITNGDNGIISVNAAYSAGAEGAPGNNTNYTLTMTGSAGNSTGGLTKIGGGTLALGGANQYTGVTTVNEGRLELDFSQASAPVSNILYNGVTAGNLVIGVASGNVGGTPSAAGVDNLLGGETFYVNGKSGTSNSQGFAGTTINPTSYTTIQTNDNGGNVYLSLGTVTPGTGSTVDFLPSGTINNGVNGINIANGNDATGIVGGWAVIYGNTKTTTGTTTATSMNYASVDANGNVTPYTGYVGVAGVGGVISDSGTLSAASNVELTGASTGTVTLSGSSDGGIAGSGATNINTLTQAASASETVNVGAGNTLRFGVNGGILLASAQNLTFSNGTVTAGGPSTGVSGTISIIAPQNGSVTFNSAIADNGVGGPVTLTYVNPNNNATLTLNASNSYSGGTYIESGRVTGGNVNSYGSGPVYVGPGGQAWIAAAGNFANTFYLSGGGDSEATGNGDYLMSLRFLNASGVVSGNVVLMSDASIGSQTSGGTISGNISGNYNLNLVTTNGGGGSNILLSGSNSFGGNLSLNGFTPGVPVSVPSPMSVKLGANDPYALPANVNVIINGSTSTTGTSTLDIDGNSVTIGSLNAYGVDSTDTAVTNSLASTPATLTVGGEQCIRVLCRQSHPRVGRDLELCEDRHRYTDSLRHGKHLHRQHDGGRRHAYCKRQPRRDPNR